MSYIIDYEISALVILFVVAVRFFTLKRFPDFTCKVFGGMIICAMWDVLLDILSCLAIDYIYSLPNWLCMFLNLSFYTMQAVMPMLMMSFIGNISGTFRSYSLKELSLLYVPFGIIMLLILTNHFHHMFFSITCDRGFIDCSSGIGTVFLYTECCFYLGVSYVIAYRHRLEMELRQYNTIAIAIFTISIVVFIQNLYPRYLITGMGITICILVMSLTMQDPADMLDFATKMFNYRAIERFLNNYNGKSQTMYLVAVDLNNFNKIKSAMDLNAFSKVLLEIGHFFNAIIYGSGWAFRMSDSRFLLVTMDHKEYMSLRNAVHYRFNKPWEVSGRSAMFSATLCCSQQHSFTDPKDVIDVLNMALDELPESSQGIEFEVDPGCLQRGIRRGMVEKAIRDALRSGKGFYLNFQPIYDNNVKKFTLAEVLLRLYSPELGIVSPGEFIPIAISSGLIRELDAMVVTMTCRFISETPQLKALGIQRLGINLSSKEYFDEAAESIRRIVEQYKVVPTQLLFEMTETITFSNFEAAKNMMRQMKKEGYVFYLDDFGTGYANIQGLAALPFNCVKLDRFLIASDDRVSRIMFDETINMLRRLEVEILVEGVETSDQLTRTNENSPRYIQGFYYSKPLAGADLISFLEKNN